MEIDDWSTCVLEHTDFTYLYLMATCTPKTKSNGFERLETLHQTWILNTFVQVSKATKAKAEAEVAGKPELARSGRGLGTWALRSQDAGMDATTTTGS